MSSEGVLPEGERIRRAVRWLLETFKEDKNKTRREVVEEAQRRFDLTPLECEFLERKLLEEGF